MKFDLLDVLKSWVTSVNPNEIEKKLAEERIEICAKCEFRKEVFHNKKWSALCGRCGCPINKKIFTDQYGTCPLGKWNFIEDKYKSHLKIKKKSII